MNEEVFQIIKFIIDSNNKSKFELNFDGLKQWLEPIKDKEVAVIPAVGSTQTGRSFLLNLIGHQFLNKDFEEEIKGFESRAGVDPITTGLWLSKPILIKRDDGTELAVLLLDTQSVFDSNTSVEDSTRILWICFLVSSCLIINLFSPLFDDFLPKLEDFLQYMRTNSGCAQSLLFMIRDWNKTQLFKHGRRGGNQFLANRLEIKGNPRALNTKRWLNGSDCFKHNAWVIDCYLWPGLGLGEDDGEFSGFADKLNQNFKHCLQELFVESLNANKLIPKVINNKTITGSELCLFFKVYAELFNGSELPNPLAITTATTETLDLILIDELKVQHSTQLKTRVSSKSGFVSRYNLFEYHKQISNELKSVFETRKKSEYPDVIEKLNEALEAEFLTNFNNVFEGNERNRQIFFTHAITDCENQYKTCLVKEFKNNRFFLSTDLMQIFDNHCKTIYKKLKNSFNGEEEDLFEADIERLKESLDRLSNDFTQENNKRMAESEEKNIAAVNESVDIYRTKMQTMVKTDGPLNEQEFKEQEQTIKAEARQSFLYKCCSGDSKFIKKFDNDFRERISRLKYDFKEELRRKIEKTFVDIEIDLIDILDKLDKLALICDSKEEFQQEALKHKEKFQDHLMVSRVSQQLVSDFTKELDTKIVAFLKSFNTISMNKLKDKESNLLSMAKGVYTENMENLLKERKVNPITLNEMHSTFKTKSIDCLIKGGLSFRVTQHKKLLKDLQEFIDQKFGEYSKKNNANNEGTDNPLQTIKKYFNSYETTMRDSREGAISETDYKAKHTVVKSKVLTSFEEIELKRSDSFGPFLPKLEQMIDESYEEFLKPFQISNELTDVRPKPQKRGTELIKGQVLAKIIEITPDGKFRLNEELLASILSKAVNCNNFALISIIGRKFSSKTFLMNCLKNNLESKDRISWPKDCSFQYDKGFHTDTNDYSLKPIIQMWGQPFILESDEQRTAVFLVDSSNVFNDESEISNTGLVKDVIELFLSISSTVLFMSEAELLSKEMRVLQSMIEESLALTPNEKYQELIYVLRDWDPSQLEDKNYLFGPKSGDRYLREVNKLGKHELNKYFESTHCYLMPSRGSHQKGSSVEFNRLSDQFLIELSNMIERKVLNVDEICVKKSQTFDRVLDPDHLNKLLRTEVNKLNGIESMDMADSADNWQQVYDSGDSISISVIDRDSDFSDEEVLQ